MGQILCCSYLGKTVTINNVSYSIEKTIGEGAFSFVQLVSKGSEKYALKRVLIQLPEHNEMAKREIKAHKAVNNRYVMRLVDSEIVTKGDMKEARLLFPYHKLGSVQEMVEVATITKNPIPEKDVISIFKSLCEGVNAFHKLDPPLAHRDIKPHNMMIFENASILMDLGSVRPARVEITNRREALAMQDLASQDCTAAFRAPELFEVPSECTITEKTDVWSLGCTLYALCYGESPCDGTALSAVNPQIKIIDQRYSKELHRLIFSMLKVPPEERPSIDEVLSELDSLC